MTRSLTYPKLIATALIWGATWIAGRVAVSEAAPLAVASWRFLLAAIALGALLVRREGWPRWRGGETLTLLALGFSGIFLYNLCFLYGMTLIEAGRGALVVALTPVLIAAGDWLFFGVPMSRLKGLGMAVALFGCLLVVSNGQPTQLLHGRVGIGEWLVVGCSLLWAIYTFVGRRGTRTLSPLAMTFGASLAGWLLLTVAAWLQGSLFVLDALSWRGGSAIVFLGLFGTAIGFTWYAEAVQHIGATRSGAFINLVPVSAVLLGALLLGERLDPAVLAGGALVVAGVVLTNRASVRVTNKPSREATR